MKKFFKNVFIFALAVCVVSLSACGKDNAETVKEAKRVSSAETVSAELTQAERESLLQSLDEIAELERAGSWLQGMAVTESAIRESLGDFPGAVAAAYKELSLAYGRGIIQKQDIEQGLLNLIEANGDFSVNETSNALLAFLSGQWDQAVEKLSLVFEDDEEPDSFSNWMMLVCSLEKNLTAGNEADRRSSNVYRSIRARYSQYPEYWYRGARAFNGTIAADFAENCINLSPEGPFANECRSILAEFTGLKSEDGLSIRTKREIEYIISQSVNSGDPQLLDPLLPLIDLPDNPYTVYAVSALRSLNASSKFREYFTARASVSQGRLAERLLYISRS